MAERPDLAAYLARAAARPFRWREDDCCTFAAGWAEELTGQPVADFVPHYDESEASCRQMLWAFGGIVAVAEAALEEAGMLPQIVPHAGDVGVIEAAGVQVMAIRTDSGWVCRLAHGLSRPRDAVALAIWGVR